MDFVSKFVFSCVIFSILIVGTPTDSFAQIQENSELVNEPLVYEVSITLMDISDIDYENGGYSVSFWLNLSSNEIDFNETPIPVVDFVNGKIDEIVYEYNDKNSYSAKIYGTFFTNMDFHNYPLMHLSLPIIIEPVHSTTDQIKLIPGKTASNIDSNLTISGLIFQKTEIDNFDYAYLDGDVFSRYVVSYEFETPFLSSFMVGIFPIFVMIGLVVFLFGLDPTNHDIKIELIIGVLISAVFFHIIEIGESLPLLTYLTLEDKVMTVLYVMLGVVMVETVSQRKWNIENDLVIATKIDKKFRLIFIIVSISIAVSLSPL